MKISKISSTIILIFALIILVVLVGLLFAIPSMAAIPALNRNYTDGSAVSLAIFLYISDLAAIGFMISLFGIMRSVSAGDPFIEKNVRLLQFIALACFAAFLSFALMIFIYANFDCFGLIIRSTILLFGALCSFVLSQVFSRAVAYKSENDLTV